MKNSVRILVARILESNLYVRASVHSSATRIGNVLRRRYASLVVAEDAVSERLSQSEVGGGCCWVDNTHDARNNAHI